MEIQAPRSFLILPDKLGHIKFTDPPSNNSTFKKKENLLLVSSRYLYQEERPRISRSKSLFQIEIRSSLSTSSVEKVWILHSSGCRSAVISYLFHKWLFSDLSKNERLFFFDIPETISDNMIFAALRARSLGYSMKSIRKVLKYTSEILFSRKPPTYERWTGYSTFDLSLESENRPLKTKKMKKYTGWRRHQNDQGSLGPERQEPFFLEPLDEDSNNISSFLDIVRDVNSGKSEIFINQFCIRIN